MPRGWLTDWLGTAVQCSSAASWFVDSPISLFPLFSSRLRKRFLKVERRGEVKKREMGHQTEEEEEEEEATRKVDTIFCHGECLSIYLGKA